MGGELCPKNIRMSWDALEEINKGSSDDKAWLHDTFKVCGAIKDSVADDISDWLQSIWFNMAMGMAIKTSLFYWLLHFV